MRNRLLLPVLGPLFVSVAAAASAQRTDVSLFCGLGWPSHDGTSVSSSIDQYATVVTNRIDDEGDASRMYGISARFLGSAGLGFEVTYERARIDIDSTTTTDLEWESVVGPQSETFRYRDGGRLDVEPLSLNAVYRAAFGERIGLAFSAGGVWERIRYRRDGRIGLVTYVGDSIETFAADLTERSSDDAFTWNAGLAFDAEIAAGWTVFVDGRYYADAGDETERRDVLAGSYEGLHLGDAVVLDEAGAAAATAELGDATAIDTTIVRAAVGIRYRF